MNLYHLWWFVCRAGTSNIPSHSLGNVSHSMLKCILFLLILDNLQVIFQNLQNLLTFFNPILSFWSSTITKNMVNKSGCIIIMKCFERRHANGHMKSSIIPKLTQMQPFDPCLLLPTNIVPKVAFQPLIHHICLAISFWMIACAMFEIFPHNFEDFFPNCTKKYVISVTNNALGKPMQSKNFFKE